MFNILYRCPRTIARHETGALHESRRRSQLRKALSQLELRDRVLLELDMTNALRPSELFALRWKCFHPAESTMRVSETAYWGKDPSLGKTRKSLGVVHTPKKLSADLWRWKQQCPDPSPEAFIFPNRDGDFMDTSNYRVVG